MKKSILLKKAIADAKPVRKNANANAKNKTMKEYYILSNRQREYLRELRTWLIENKCEDKVQWDSDWDTFPTTKTIYLPIDKVSRILANNSYYPNDRDEMNALREYYKRVK